jgi:hypothetical protein
MSVMLTRERVVFAGLEWAALAPAPGPPATADLPRLKLSSSVDDFWDCLRLFFDLDELSEASSSPLELDSSWCVLVEDLKSVIFNFFVPLTISSSSRLRLVAGDMPSRGVDEAVRETAGDKVRRDLKFQKRISNLNKSIDLEVYVNIA